MNKNLENYERKVEDGGEGLKKVLKTGSVKEDLLNLSTLRKERERKLKCRICSS